MNDQTIPTGDNAAANEDAILCVQLSKLRASAGSFASANGTHRATVKHVEANGLNPKIAKEALAIAKSGDAAKKVEELQTLFRYLRLLGIEVTNEQLDLFDVSPARAPIEEKARDDGLRAGRMGDGIETCQHDPSTAAYRFWRDGHQIGTRERDLILAMPAPLIKGERQGDADGDDFDDALEEA